MGLRRHAAAPPGGLAAHARLSSEARAKAGVPDGFIRLSVGLEDADDLIDDLKRALKAATK